MKTTMLSRLLIAFSALLVASCSGYKLGGSKPSALADIGSIAVPMFANETLEPRVGAIATNEAVSSLAADGTYRIATSGDADAILYGIVKSIKYVQLRTERLDTLRPSELGNHIIIDWELKDAGNPTKVLARGTATGVSRFFVGDNIQTARTNALPDACRQAANDIASNLGDGF